MKLLFNLEYHTIFGEQLVLNILDENGSTSKHAMITYDGRNWVCELGWAGKSGTYIDYYYSVVRGEETVRNEWLTVPHRLELAAVKGAHYVVFDHWIDIPEDSYLYSSAFTECVMRRERQLSTKTEYERTVRLKVRAPQLQQNQRLAIVGAPLYLGGWDTEKAIPMAEHEYHEWVVSLDGDRLPGRFDFKFVLVILGQLGHGILLLVHEVPGSKAATRQ